MSFVWVATNLEHVQNAKVAISVNDPINFDTLQVVDRYVENGTGFCAERVHDTDLQNALLGVQKELVHLSANTALPAAVPTWVVTSLDVRQWRWIAWCVKNTGLVNPITASVSIGDFFTPGGTFLSYNSSGVAIPANTTSGSQMGTHNAAWWAPSYSTNAVFGYLSLFFTSALGTTAQVAVYGSR